MTTTQTSPVQAQPKSRGAPKSVVKSAERVLKILEFFDAVQRPACVTEVARALSYPQSSTSALLQSMVVLGYLQHDRFERTFYPTPRVSLLGNWLDPALLGRGTLLARAEQVAKLSGQRTVIAAVNGLHAQYIYIQRYAGMDDAGVRIGAMQPLARTAVGLALMSTYDDVAIAKLVRRFNAERRTGEALIAVGSFVASLRASQEQGYFTGEGAIPGQVAVATVIDGSAQTLAFAVEGDGAALKGRELELAALLAQTA